MFAFLVLNLSYRFLTVFGYSRFIDSVFIFLGLCSLAVILFPNLLRVFLFFFGASFFLFGFRGYDIQSQVFETIVVFVALSVFALNIRNRSLKVENRHISLLLICYITLSVSSLLLLPITHILKNFWYIGWEGLTLQIANATPNVPLYPLTGINRLILFSVFILEVARAKNSRELFKWLFIGIFSGCIVCVLLGFLDYYQFYSLAWYRIGSIEEYFNTTFQNSRWFAEFVLTTIPFVLIGLTSKINGVWWKILSLGSIMVCSIAMILEGSRAGWILYPLVLFICWLFFYYSTKGRLESLRFKWQDLAKPALFVTITIIVSIFFLFQVVMPLYDNLIANEKISEIGSRSERTKQLIKKSALRFTRVEPGGRLYTWQEGFNVGRESPILGLGYESFNWHANILAAIPNSYYGKFKAKWIHDTPHNIFLQIFVSGGIVGLWIWIFMVGYAIMILIIDLKKNNRLLNMPVIISIISFHLYGLFQSMQYVPMIWMLIFLNLGYAMTIPESAFSKKSAKIWGRICAGFLVVVALSGIGYAYHFESRHLVKKYGLSIYAKDQDRDHYIGFYGPEKWGDDIYRWSSRRGLLKFSGNGLIGLTFQFMHPDIDKRPVKLEIVLNGKVIDRLTVFARGSIGRQYYLHDVTPASHQIMIKVSRTWIPKAFNINEDRRSLGVAVSNMRHLKLMPTNGIGFYKIESSSGDLKSDHTNEIPLTFQSTGQRASLNIEKEIENSESIYLMCAHPNIDKHPVRVEIIGDNGIIKQEYFINHKWKKIALNPDEPKRQNVLTFQVNRTWNPKLMGISGDSRDLGVAVAFVK